MKKKLLGYVLAAGQGTRFKSSKIKILHPLLGQPMVKYVIDTVQDLYPESIHVVVGYQKEIVMKTLPSPGIEFIIQQEQLGTAHAVMAAEKILEKKKDCDLLVINGDLPLIRKEDIAPIMEFHQKENNALTFLAAHMDNPYGFGRIIDEGKGKYRVVEENEATSNQKKIKETNAGIYVFQVEALLEALPKVSNKNSKGEYYITDLVEILSSMGKKTRPYKSGFSENFVGVNDRFEMAQAVKSLRLRKIRKLCLEGVTIVDPSSSWIEQEVEVGRDTVIHPSAVLEGKTSIGKECSIGPFVHVRGSQIGDEVKIMTSSVIEESRLENEVQVGPFSHLRPGTLLQAGARVGNYVELKNTRLGRRSKALHLSYLGDSEIGEEVNVGAGTITCNYDGVKKYKTVIEDGAFIGSGTQLVAPLKVGKGAYIGAGSTITKNVSPDSLAVARSRQVEKSGWARRKKKKA